MSRRLFHSICPLLLLAVSFNFCHGKSLTDAGDEATIEHLGDCSSEPEVKDVCDQLCGDNSCRNRQHDKSLLPVQHFCFCHEKLPQNNSIFDCDPETENSTLKGECQMTCANLFDPAGNGYSDYYCYSQDEDEKKDEDCICVASSALHQQESESELEYDYGSDSDYVNQNLRKKRRTTKRPTNAASCTNVGGGTQTAVSCQLGQCYTNCPGGQIGSNIPPGSSNGNGNNAPGGSDYSNSNAGSNLFDGNSVIFGK